MGEKQPSEDKDAGNVAGSPSEELTATSPEPEELLSAKPFPIVGIGASAGGLEAFSQLLGRLPEHPKMAFVLVQHLDPTHESQLAELLSKHARMSIQEAVEGLEVLVDHVYVIPPNTTMSISNGVLRLVPRGDSRAPHLSVDHFLTSLAEDQRSRAIGVVLSGSGSDGAVGLEEIKAAGGITFAQDESSAKHSSMPRHAAQSGHVDFVLSPEEIAERLAQIGSHPYITSATEPSKRGPEGPEGDYQRILGSVMAVTGVDFAQYRETTIMRRIMRRMALHGHRAFAKYAEHLEGDRSEVDALYRDLLINVTSFFRDPDMFEELKSRVFPELAKNRSVTDTIRVWVAGCSTGQEAYSIAMALMEFFDDRPVRPPVQIFASDIGDLDSLSKARAGIYPESIAAEVSPERLSRFFRKEDHIYCVGKAVRDMCVFARQDLAKDPPFSHVDIISCRNVLIYMSPILQKQVLSKFHYALNVPGFLVLGSAESVGEHADLFGLLDRTHKLFAKKPMASRPHYRLWDDAYKGAGPSRPSGPLRPAPFDVRQEADRLALNEYVPPGVLVNGGFEVLQFRGKTGPYLESPPGDPTSNLLKMAREGLFLELRGALNEAKSGNQIVYRKGLRVRGESGYRQIDLRVLPVRSGESGEDCYLVLFEETESSQAADPGSSTVAGPAPRSIESGSTGVRFWRRKSSATPRRAIPQRRAEDREPKARPEADVAQLSHELAATKEYLQSLIEQQDVANEELRSANEEILSSNEELQSTNEEMETAKEELQSTNEELITVNEQLQHRNLEANLLNDDLTNFLTSTNIPAFMVGMDLRIRRATPAARSVLNLLPNETGRSVADIQTRLGVPDLSSWIAEVTETVRARSQEIQDQTGSWWLLHVHPYRTTDNRIDGVVISLRDIDTSKRIQVELEEARGYAQAIVETVSEPLIVLDANLRIKTANRAFYETFALALPQAEGRSLFDLDPLTGLSDLKRMLQDVLPLGGNHEISAEVLLPRFGPRPFVFRGRGIYREDYPPLILLSLRDLSEERRSRDEAATAARRKDEFLAMLAHELRNPLGSVVFALETLQIPEGEPEKRKQAHGVLQRQVRQLVRMVDDLLDMSRITQGKIEMHKERIELAPIIRAAVETCRYAIEALGHRLIINLPPEPIVLEGDPTRLAQVMANLLHNAAKFTPGGGVIEIDAKVSADDGDSSRNVVIRVRDNGVGIPAELLPRVYEMFAQGDRSLERARGGLGVGLTLVKSIVLGHGGTVEARSEGLGKGSEFIIRLPLAPAPAPILGEPEPTRVDGADGIPLRVLVVDDNVDFADMVKLTLEDMGHEVRLAHEGRAALEAVDTWKPEVVLLDIGLPHLNGYEVARRIRDREGESHAALVALTGWGQTEDKRLSMVAGFDYHLVKPADAQALGKLLEEIQLARRT